MEEDIGGKLEKNVLQDGAQVHEVKNSADCFVTESLDMGNAGASNENTEIANDSEMSEIVSVNEVIFSFPCNSAESKYPADQINCTIEPVNVPVACDRVSHGSADILPADEKNAPDHGSDGNGGIRRVHNDHGGSVSGSLGAGDSKKACDRGDHDQSGIKPSDSINTSNRVGHDKSATGPTDGKKSCDQVDHHKKQTTLSPQSANNPQSPVPLPAPPLTPTDEGNGRGDFNTLHKDSNRNSKSLPKFQSSRGKTGNLETRSCAKAALNDNVLKVSGLNETTTKDGLVNFIEVLSGEEVKDIIMLKQGNALVTMSTQVQGL